MIFGAFCLYSQIYIVVCTLSKLFVDMLSGKAHVVPSKRNKANEKKLPFTESRIAPNVKNAADDLY